MNRRSAALPLAALATFAILIAACGGNAATTGPSSGTPATQTPPTQAPATQAPAGTGEPTFAIPSFHADQKLEDMFPDQIGGKAVSVQSITAGQFMGSGSSPELEAALGTVGKSAADLSIAYGVTSITDSAFTIIAFRVAGVPGGQLLAALTAAFQKENQFTSSDVNLGGKSVKKLVPSDTTEDTTYVYAAQDAVFTVGGSAITDALLNEIFSKLP
jgi:hypothetical protein